MKIIWHFFGLANVLATFSETLAIFPQSFGNPGDQDLCRARI
jgi:hypothetical protein